jgi:hypothetical protein
MSRILKAALLFFLFAICGLSFVVAHRLREQLPPPAPHELFAAVNEQISAFRSADFQSAYRHAAAGVQQKFTLTQFQKMALRHYPEAINAQRVEFGAIKVQGSSATVQVFLFGSDRSVRSFIYSLTNEDDTWKIDGVEEVKGYRAGGTLGGTSA